MPPASRFPIAAMLLHADELDVRELMGKLLAMKPEGKDEDDEDDEGGEDDVDEDA